MDIIPYVFQDGQSENKITYVIDRIEKNYKYLVGHNILNEGFFIIWDGKNSVGELNQQTYMELLQEAKMRALRHHFMYMPGIRFIKLLK